MKIAPHLARVDGDGTTSSKTPFWKKLRLLGRRGEAAEKEYNPEATSKPTLNYQGGSSNSASTTALSRSLTSIGKNAVVDADALKQHWGEDFDGLEIGYLESNNLLTEPQIESQEKRSENQEQATTSTKPSVKRHGSVWHQSLRESESLTTKRNMRSRASLMGRAQQIEFDSEAFSEEDESSEAK